MSQETLGKQTLSSLILVTCDSGAGHLKQERLADRILAFTHRLVTGPTTADGAPGDFFRDRQSIYQTEGLFHEPWWFEVEDATQTNPKFKRVWSRLPEVCLQHDIVTLWIDPDTNAQLVLLQLLDWLGRIPDIAQRLWLKQSESAIGARRAGDWFVPPRPIEPADVTLASRAWAAFRSSTPEAWAALRDDPALGRLPGLNRAVHQMLDELPDATGLGGTERRLLRLAERHGWWDDVERRGGDVCGRTLPDIEREAHRLIGRTLEFGPRLPLGYFETGEALCNLAGAPAPALRGVTEPRYATVALLEDPERFRRFRESIVSLTNLGHRLVAGADDWSHHNRIHRWWGGTRLTNETLWRWDAANGRLSATD